MTKKIGIILSIAVVIRLFFILTTPATWVSEKTGIQAHNDEPSHINYVKYLIVNRSFPVQKHHIQESDAFTRNTFEYYQPPLSYWLCSLLPVIIRMNPESLSFVYYCRIFNLILGLLSLILFYRILAFLSCGSAVFYTLLFSWMPIHIRHSASFGNDMLAWLFCLLLFYAIIKRMTSKSISTVGMLSEGVLIGLAVLSKSSMLSFILFYSIAGLADRYSHKQWMIPAFVGLSISAPYFIRNMILYHKFFGIVASCGPPLSGLSTMTPHAWFHFFQGLLISVVFPYDTLSIPFLLKAPAYIFWVVIFLSAGFFILKQNHWRIFTSKFSLKQHPGLFFLIVFASIILYNWHYVQTESRLIFHGIMALFILLSVRFCDIRLRMKWILAGGALYPLVFVLVFSFIVNRL